MGKCGPEYTSEYTTSFRSVPWGEGASGAAALGDKMDVKMKKFNFPCAANF